jgi:hypothetical protein
MNEDCPRSAEVEKAAVAGLAPELAAHVAGCAACREAALVVRSLTKLAAATADLADNPPAAGAIYMRSRLLGRLARDREGYERAAWPLRAAAAATVGLAAASTVILTLAAGSTPGPEVTLWIVAATPGLLLVSALLVLRD